MKKLVIAILIGVGALGCGKGGKQVGPEVCGVVAAKAKLCNKEFWTFVEKDPTYGATYRKEYEGKEEPWCQDQFKMHQAQGEVFDSCLKVDDCKAWSECVYPKGFFGGNK